MEQPRPGRTVRRVAIFVGWHKEAAFWREIYARTVSALTAALVLLIVATIAGYVSLRSLIGALAGAALGIVTVLYFPLLFRFARLSMPARKAILGMIALTATFLMVLGGLLLVIVRWG